MFGRAVDEMARQHAIAAYPHEACGLVVNYGYRPCRNISEDPAHTFTVDPKDVVAAELLGMIQAVIHSHPDGPGHPTASDIDQQRKSGFTWGLISTSETYADKPVWWGPGVPMASLIGRQFVYNIWDCYTLARDYYHSEHGIMLPDPPATDFEWWKTDPGAEYYVRGLAEQGFKRIDKSNLRPGDGFVASIASTAVNHCGVYLGDGLILHHLQGALSRREPLIRWQPHIRYYLRHKDLNQ